MKHSTDLDDSSFTHPQQQWSMHRNEFERVFVGNAIQTLGNGLHPCPDREAPAVIDNRAFEMQEPTVFLWRQRTFNSKAFIRWRNIQRSIAIAIFSPIWGVFVRIPVWNSHLHIVNIIEQLTKSLRLAILELVYSGYKQVEPLFECHIYEPVFDNMTKEFVESADQIKSEVIRMVRPTLKHFVNVKFKVKPFKGTLLDHQEEGPAIEAQWVPEAERMVVALCRELKPDGTYGKVEDLEWAKAAKIKNVNDVPLPDWAVKLTTAEGVRPMETGV